MSFSKIVNISNSAVLLALCAYYSTAMAVGIGADIPKSVPPIPSPPPAKKPLEKPVTPGGGATPGPHAPSNGDTPGDTISNLPPPPLSVATAPAPPPFVRDDAAEQTRKPQIITRDDIERFNGYDLAQLLQTYVGLDIRRLGGGGADSVILINGADDNQLAIYVDDVRVSNRTHGGYAWQTIPLPQIGWIEIRRGIEATRQGEGAIGASVHIYTKRPFTSGASYAGMVDNNGLLGLEAGFYGQDKSLYFDLSLQRHTGISATNRTNASYNGDLDGARQLAARAGYLGKWTATSMFDLSMGYTHDEHATDPGGNTNDFFMGRIAVHSIPDKDHWQQKFHIAGWHNLSNLDEDTRKSRIRSAHAEILWNHQIPIGRESIWRFDLHANSDAARWTDVTSSVIKLENRVISYAGAAFTADFPAWRNDFTLHARYDHYDIFGPIGTYGLQWGRHIGFTGLYSSLAVHSAYSAPTIADRYYANDPGNIRTGNPDIDFERSAQINWDLRYQFDLDHQIKVSFYGDQIDRVITYPSPAQTPQNNEQYKLWGARAEYRYRDNDWQFRLVADQQGARAKQIELPYRPAQKLLTHLNKRIGGGYSFDILAQFISERYADKGQLLEPYALISGGVTRNFTAGLAASMVVSNVLNNAYQTEYGYNMPGRAILMRVRYSPRVR